MDALIVESIAAIAASFVEIEGAGCGEWSGEQQPLAKESEEGRREERVRRRRRRPSGMAPAASEGRGSEVQVDAVAHTNSATPNQPHVQQDVLAAGRASCYKARDAFFNCVEADSGHTTSTEVASVGLLYPSQCKPARAFFEENCRSTWVKHFDRQYSAKKRVKRLLDTGDRTRGSITMQPGE